MPSATACGSPRAASSRSRGSHETGLHLSGPAKRMFAKLPRIDEWRGFLLGAVVLALGAAMVEFMNGLSASGASGPRALDSLEFGFLLVLAALLTGAVVWGVIRI